MTASLPTTDLATAQGIPDRGIPCDLLPPTLLPTSQSPLSSSIAFSTTWNAQTVVDCPAYLTAPECRPLPQTAFETFYSGHTLTLRRLNHLVDYQAPGTNPAASELPALAILSAIRVSWLRGCYSSGHAWYVRRSGRHSFLYCCRDFWGQNVEAAPLPIHAQFVTVTSSPYRAASYILSFRLSYHLPVSPCCRAFHG